VKTTVDIPDALFARAKQHARRAGRPMRALIVEGLSRVLSSEGQGARYRLPDCSAGSPRGKNPLEALSWPELRDEIYGGR
jgi:hypothetical protein